MDSLNYSNLVTAEDKIIVEKANELYKLFQKEVIDQIVITARDVTLINNIDNIVIARIRDKNRQWNKEMAMMGITFLDDFFIKQIKEKLLSVDSVPESFKNALNYL